MDEQRLLKGYRQALNCLQAAIDDELNALTKEDYEVDCCQDIEDFCQEVIEYLRLIRDLD